MLAIDIKGLRKTYKVATGGTYEALRGVDLEVQEGHLFGFVGVNGAGKSTLIKSLIGLIHFSQGDIGGNQVKKLTWTIKTDKKALKAHIESPLFDATVKQIKIGG